MTEAVATYNPDLEQAMNFEAQLAAMGLDDLMTEIMENAGVDKDPTLDEMKVRRMIFALRYLDDEIETQKRMKKAIAAEWDSRIKKKEQQQEQIKEQIAKFVNEHNNGKALALDVATVSMKKKAAAIVIKDKAALRNYLVENDELHKFLKPGDLDETLAKKALLARLESNQITLDDLEGIGEYQEEGKSLAIRMK